MSRYAERDDEHDFEDLPGKRRDFSADEIAHIVKIRTRARDIIRRLEPRHINTYQELIGILADELQMVNTEVTVERLFGPGRKDRVAPFEESVKRVEQVVIAHKNQPSRLKQALDRFLNH